MWHGKQLVKQLPLFLWHSLTEAKNFSRRQVCCKQLFSQCNTGLSETINPTSILEESYHLQQRWNDSNGPVQLQLHFDLDEIDVQIR